ncbi:MAG TPA: hypothetical protein VFP89_13970 [Propionibacteriaceae bacterium]|nr:hypothetical protein [Propionibacteriaceae bacterium]
MVHIREAAADDLDQIVRLARARRARHAAYQPRLWRPAADADSTQLRLLRHAVTDPEVLMLVAVDHGPVRGFLLARLVQSPAVYDPGGPICFVDDFHVEDDASWATMGVQLLRAAVVRAAARSATSVVVVAAVSDLSKRRSLSDAGLSVSSEWWSASIGRPLSPGEASPDATPR